MGEYRVEGRVTVNGEQCGLGRWAVDAVSAYAEQDDLFMASLTVKEHLDFQALLRIDGSKTRKQKLRKSLEVMVQFGLVRCRNVQIGVPADNRQGISHEERKLLAIATQALTNPSIFFCDEPITYLDRFMAQEIVDVLKIMALQGKSILCTINQPASEIYEMFDKILMLSEGRTLFFGTSQEALVFFENLGYPCPSSFNPADYFIEIMATVVNC